MKRIGYIISIGVLIVTLIIGILIINSNNELVYTKKDKGEYTRITKRMNEIDAELTGLKKEQIKEFEENGKTKKYLKISYKVDNLNSERANLDMDLDSLERNKVTNYVGMIPGFLVIILGIIISSLVFVKTRRMNEK